MEECSSVLDPILIKLASSLGGDAKSDSQQSQLRRPEPLVTLAWHMEQQSDTKFANRRPGWQPGQLDIRDLQLHPFTELERSATSRQSCPQCNRSRHMYCYDCLVPFTAVPPLQLPFQLSIITHHAELASKNTGVHAALLCPEQVQLHSIEQMPSVDPARCVVMFPCDDALLPEQLDVHQIDRVVIIDSKWRKAKELNGHKALNGMRRVKLSGHPKSCFWRFHTEGVTDEGVCTIEALHLLLRSWADQLPEQPYNHNPDYFDNILWYFAFQHQLVTKAAAERQQKQKRRGQQHQPKVQQTKNKRHQGQQEDHEQEQQHQRKQHDHPRDQSPQRCKLQQPQSAQQVTKQGQAQELQSHTPEQLQQVDIHAGPHNTWQRLDLP